MVSYIELFEYPDPTPIDFCFWGWMKSEVDTCDELLARISDAVARITKRDEEVIRKTGDIRTRVENGISG